MMTDDYYWFGLTETAFPFWTNAPYHNDHFDSLHQVRWLGGVLLGVYNEAVNMFLTCTFYTPKVAEMVPL